MSVILGLLTLATLIAIPVAVARPRLIVPKGENPSRIKAAVIALWLFLPCLALWIWSLPPAAPKGIGLSRAQVAAIFAAQGCVLEKSSDVDGVERWGGHNGAVLCEAIGPEHDISRIYMLHALIKGDAPGALDAVVRVNEMRKGVFPNWEDGGKWLVSAYSNGSGDTIIKDGLEVEAKLMPTLGIGLGIRAQPKK